MPEEVQDLLEQLAQDNQVSVDEIKQDLQNRINQAWEDPEDKYPEFRRFFKYKNFITRYSTVQLKGQGKKEKTL